MNKKTALASVLAMSLMSAGMPISKAEPVTMGTIAAAAAATVVVDTAGKMVQDCRVKWKPTDIKVFGRKVGRTNLPQYFCNPPKNQS